MIVLKAEQQEYMRHEKHIIVPLPAPRMFDNHERDAKRLPATSPGRLHVDAALVLGKVHVCVVIPAACMHVLCPSGCTHTGSRYGGLCEGHSSAGMGAWRGGAVRSAIWRIVYDGAAAMALGRAWAGPGQAPLTAFS